MSCSLLGTERNTVRGSAAGGGGGEGRLRHSPRVSAPPQVREKLRVATAEEIAQGAPSAPPAAPPPAAGPPEMAPEAEARVEPPLSRLSPPARHPPDPIAA